eukprot:562425-Amphidinium_carterae.1
MGLHRLSCRVRRSQTIVVNIFWGLPTLFPLKPSCSRRLARPVVTALCRSTEPLQKWLSSKYFECRPEAVHHSHFSRVTVFFDMLVLCKVYASPDGLTQALASQSHYLWSACAARMHVAEAIPDPCSLAPLSQLYTNSSSILLCVDHRSLEV